MSGLIRRSSLRHFAHHPWIGLLAVLGVALGVAVVVSIDLTGRSAQLSFELATDTVAGRATHRILGGPEGVPEEVYRALRLDGMRSCAPVIEGSVIAETSAGRRALTLLGVDPFAEGAFRSYSAAGLRSRGLLADLLGGAPAVLLSEATARGLEVAPDDLLSVRSGSRTVELRLAAYLESDDPLQAAGLESLLLMDISAAQGVLGLEGRLSRIDLRLDETHEEVGLLAALDSQLSSGLRLVRSASRSETAAELTRAFRINLQALSLLALLCGAFLIYNSVTFSVVLRRRQFATLRVLGAARGRILRLVFGEAVLIGLVGSLLGVALGIGLARGLVGMVSQTVSDFYFNSGSGRLTVDPVSLIAGAVLGTLTAGLAGLRPAWEATSVQPRVALQRSSLETTTHRAARRAALAAVPVLAAGCLILAFGRSIATSFSGVFTVLLGFTLATPLAVVLLVSLAGRLFGGRLSITGRLAVRSVTNTLSRTGVAVSALMMALAVAMSISLMISSFRTTVERWLLAALPADLYITSPAPGSQDAVPVSSLEDGWLTPVSRLPEIERVNSLRRARVPSTVGEIVVVAVDIDSRSYGAFALKKKRDGVWDDFHAGRAVLASEPLAFRKGLEPGATIELGAASRTRTLPIGGVFYDYSTDRGYLLMSLELYRSLWDDTGLTAASAFVRDGVDLGSVAESVRAVLPAQADLIVRSDAVLRSESLRVFDRTFRVTGVLRTLAVIVAMIGILGSLMALQLERTREIGLLRATGLTPGQVWRLVTTQTALMGLISGLLALPVGISMAAMMIFIVNRRSFGWTMPMEIEPSILLQTIVIAVLVAIIAGLVPARRMAAVSPAEALREE